jgi:hypothetical protein
LTSAIAPSRGGSSSALSIAPSASRLAAWPRTDRRRQSGPIRELVGLRVGLRAAHQRRTALDTDDPRPAPRDWQAEVAQSAKEIGDRIAFRRLEQAYRAAHQHAIHRDIDLGEIGRLKLDAHAEIC